MLTVVSSSGSLLIELSCVVVVDKHFTFIGTHHLLEVLQEGFPGPILEDEVDTIFASIDSTNSYGNLD